MNLVRVNMFMGMHKPSVLAKVKELFVDEDVRLEPNPEGWGDDVVIRTHNILTPEDVTTLTKYGLVSVSTAGRGSVGMVL